MEDDIDALLQMNTVSICSSNLMGDNLYHNQIYEESKRERLREQEWKELENFVSICSF